MPTTQEIEKLFRSKTLTPVQVEDIQLDRTKKDGFDIYHWKKN